MNLFNASFQKEMGQINIQRFEKYISVEPNSGCWLWTGAWSKSGYGSFRVENKSQNAHRVAYKLYLGPLKNGMMIDHICRNRACVSPDHLRQVTPRQNILENSMSISAISAKRNCCKRGHVYVPGSFRITANKRVCKLCRESWPSETRKAAE